MGFEKRLRSGRVPVVRIWYESFSYCTTRHEALRPVLERLRHSVHGLALGVHVEVGVNAHGDAGTVVAREFLHRFRMYTVERREREIDVAQLMEAPVIEVVIAAVLRPPAAEARGEDAGAAAVRDDRSLVGLLLPWETCTSATTKGSERASAPRMCRRLGLVEGVGRVRDGLLGACRGVRNSWRCAGVGDLRLGDNLCYTGNIIKWSGRQDWWTCVGYPMPATPPTYRTATSW